MTTRHGLCTNFGLCSKADGREPIAAAQEFVCPECGKPLGLARQGSNSSRRVTLIAVSAALVLAGGLYALVPAAPAPVAPEDVTSSGGEAPEAPRQSPQPRRRPLPRASNDPLPVPGSRLPFDPSEGTGALDEPRRVRVAGRPGRTTAAPTASEVPVTATVLPTVPVPSAPTPVTVPTAVAPPSPPPSTPAWPPLNKTQVTVELLTPITDQGGSAVGATVRDGAYAGATVRGRAVRESGGLLVQFDSIEYRGETRRVIVDLRGTPNASHGGGFGTTLTQIGTGSGVVIALDVARGKGGKEAIKDAATSAIGNLFGRMVAPDQSPKVVFDVGTVFTLMLTDPSASANR
jgi:hypothetical protein